MTEEIDLVAISQANAGPFTFRNPNFKGTNRRVKPLKQILVDEQKYIKANQDSFKKDAVFYNTIEAPPSIKPTKKYCDITGLKANYRSPTTGIRYHNSEVFTVVKNMSQGVDQQYLELRNANVILK